MIERLTVSCGECANDFDDQIFFYCGELSFDTARNVQSRISPLTKWEICIRKNRRIGARKRSTPFRPMRTAGRTFWLVKSVNGIGRSTTSFLEQFIEDVVRVVVPDLIQSFFGQFQPRFAFCVGAFNCDSHVGFFRQRQRSRQNQLAVFVNGFKGRCHVSKLSFGRLVCKTPFVILHLSEFQRTRRASGFIK